MGVAMVGFGHTKFGKHDALDIEDLIREAGAEAIADSGIDPKDIDAAWLGHFNSGLVPDAFCSSMVIGIDPALRFQPATRCENACASGAAALFSAIDAIESGRVRAALVVGAEKMSGRDTAGVTESLAGASYQREERGTSFPQIFARVAKAYAEEFGDPAEGMARVAVKNHENALRNPLAQMHRPIDLDFALNVSDKNPMIADPLKLSDCSLISDGAAAVVLVNTDILSDFRRGVALRGTAHVNDALPLSAKRPAHFEGPTLAFQRAFDAAGVTVDDVDFAEVHDCFTIAELLAMEAMGLAPRGQASALMAEGQTNRGGRLPINLSGGLKAKGHPVGATGVSMHVVTARQLLGEAGEMQMENTPEIGAILNMGGGAVASYVSVLERAR